MHCVLADTEIFIDAETCLQAPSDKLELEYNEYETLNSGEKETNYCLFGFLTWSRLEKNLWSGLIGKKTYKTCLVKVRKRELFCMNFNNVPFSPNPNHTWEVELRSLLCHSCAFMVIGLHLKSCLQFSFRET